ncbi:hypothetical protein GPK34_11070 [Secundilactobacillus kimchicus]|uniref:Uncharacterized protein n=1 Tax=Secundilactobacillus kimchicus JCM 15530 TaxID=1302272 RepID=A0A0R1HMY1_9LACO|nr:hypothetical protein [Secundilactobacillus kimchicus]KRK47768.1 hypothetical protein FC96_GL002256 [Secundilactobacillus kimchicus JCM 15530]MBT9672566.1 hypothetical protein [Secundilactobacillus kimchicus]
MNNQEPKSRMQRYDFNTGDNKGPKRPRKSPRLRQIIIGFIVALILVVGVGVWLANRSTSVENSSPESSETVSDSSNDESDSQDSSDNDDSSDDTDTTETGDVTDNGAAPTQGRASTPTPPQNRGSNRESNATTKNGGQSTSRSGSRNQNAQSGTSNSTNDSSTQPSQDTGSNDSSTSGGIDFSSPHTFSSVEDARSWASATRSDWLKQGYTNYTITQDPQGNYVLAFTK